MTPVLALQAATLADLRLLSPELILVGTALGILLIARRIRRSPVAGRLTILAALASGVSACWLLPAGSADGARSIEGFGGLFVIDSYSQFFKVLVSATLAVVALVSRRSVDRADAPHGEYNALLLLAATGMMLAVSAVDLLTLYLGLELTTLCSYVLVGITVDRQASNEAAIKYFLLGSFASALLLFGISLTYGTTGATEFDAIAGVLADGNAPLPLAAIGLVLAGIAFKVAAVPFHAWAPDAYQASLTPVAAFMATGSKAAGLAALGRISIVAFEPAGEFVSIVLIGLAALSILAGSLLALPQMSMKRLLAYSSIAHAGYALLGLVAGSPEGVSATMTYAFFYVFMTLGVFGVVITLGERGQSLDGYRGLAAQRPVTAALMLLFLLALTGIPPTAGFTAKFGVILSVVTAGHVGLAVLAVLCSVVSAFVYLRIAVLIYMEEPTAPAPARMTTVLALALGLAAVVTVAGGVLPGSLTAWAVSP